MDTIRVRRANVILDVALDSKDYYMAKGYSVIDVKTGKVIEEAVSNDVKALQAQVKTLQAEIVEKDTEIAKLKKAKTTAKPVKTDAE